LTITNGLYSATFESKNFPKANGPFGIKYTFELLDAIDKCPEYLVHPKEFVKFVSLNISK